MTDSKEQDNNQTNDQGRDTERKTPLRLSLGKLELTKTVETGQVRQSFSHGRSKAVTVEVRKKRTFAADSGGILHEVKDKPSQPKEAETSIQNNQDAELLDSAHLHDLTHSEKAARMRALKAMQADEDSKKKAEERAHLQALEKNLSKTETYQEPSPEQDLAVSKDNSLENQSDSLLTPELFEPIQPIEETKKINFTPVKYDSGLSNKNDLLDNLEDGDEDRGKRPCRSTPHKIAPAIKRGDSRRREGKLTITAALDDDDRSQRGRSLASVKRARERERLKQMQNVTEKVIREVILPETISVQELANRMAERGANVIKCLMKNGILATINQMIDADTAELVATEFGHTVKRIAESDIEIGLSNDESDHDIVLVSRPPVVTVMGHVDHGKTSLLDALRSTDVVSGEAGGITQHIGAYVVTMKNKQKITFIDTPGHEAFTAMRARGAKVTDIVVLVVAADDGIMPQTIEAIRHAQAAKVPIIVAINKIDKADADPTKIRQALLTHELVTEDMGGDVLAVEVSAKNRLNLEALEEAILLQAEILDLKANIQCLAQGVVVEARMERGRGSVATVLVQKGTLRVGDVFVAGSEWGKIRALIDDHGHKVDSAGPAIPVEILGIQGTPSAGDDFVVVENEMRAREVSAYRQRRDRNLKAAAGARGTLEQMFSRIAAGEIKELPVVIKGDMQGSIEALNTTLEKMGNEEVRVKVLHSAVGAINESDITLARASDALVIGFNVRANPQARDLARRDNIDIRYYSIIYNVADDLKQALGGMLAPTLRENFLGYAEIREVFNITKVGKVAGCFVTEGLVKRGAKVRLLRDNVVIHEGDLGQLRRFKEDVREVKDGYECGMSFVNYNDIQVSDVIECYEIEEIASSL
jgi:translation initiation factor IF-2